MSDELDKLEKEKGIDIPIHVDAASGGFFGSSFLVSYPLARLLTRTGSVPVLLLYVQPPSLIRTTSGTSESQGSTRSTPLVIK
jgi:hypothetical protein